MPKPFLYNVMDDLYRRFDGNLQDVTVVFPNKRAGLFANQYLSQIVGRPVWAPRYTAISEFFSSLTDKEVPEKMELLIYLYNAYQKSRKDEKLAFEAFYGWGEVLLSDFQDIDNNMVDADALFSNISALEAINRLDYLEPSQVEAIKVFFTDFDPDDTNRLHRRFVDMWNSMPEIYNQFHHDLAAAGLAYDAMLKREVIETLELKGSEPQELRDSQHHYAIVGFNVLNETERRLFRYLKTNADVLFYWDYDPTFIRNEAARFIEDNLLQFPNALPVVHSQLPVSVLQKEVNIVSASTDQAQASYVTHWLKDYLPADRPLNQTAVVLADENLLQGVLHALPDTEVNITMGYPLRQTAISSLVSSLLNLQTRGKAKCDSWYHTYVTAILRHPYILQLYPQQAKALYADMHRHNEMYPSVKYIQTIIRSVPLKGQCQEGLASLFTPQNSETLLPYLADIVRRIGIANKHSDPLTVESIFTTYTVITSLHSQLFMSDAQLPVVNVSKSMHLLDEENQTAESIATPEARQANPNAIYQLNFVSTILSQQLSSQSIAFHGEPATGLQVMGMLETRNLDFKDVVILSANEGLLPKVSHSASFIPYFLRETNNMTTIEKQTSLYAYYFFRLLQRAQHVSLVYNSSTEGLKKGEMSRFLLQLKLEKELPVTITEQAITSPIAPQTPMAQDYQLSALNWSLSLPEESDLPTTSNQLTRLSPSSLNTYLTCKMQFFLRYVAKLQAPDEISEEIEADMFGNITHEVLEKIYRPYIGTALTASFLQGLASDKKRIELLVDQAFSHLLFNQTTYVQPKYNGEQMLNRHVVIQYVIRQLRYDSTLAPLTILALEMPVEAKFPTLSKDFTLVGRIDRIDQVTIDGRAVTRIVDYKTSNKIQSVKTLDDLFDPEHTSPHIFQILCYADMLASLRKLSAVSSVSQSMTDLCYELSPAVGCSLNYLKKLSDKSHTPVVNVEGVPITDYATQLQAEFHPRLQTLIAELFDSKVMFTQADTDKPCTYCDFKQICQTIGRK